MSHRLLKDFTQREMEKDISRTLLLRPLSDSRWPPWPIQTSYWSEPDLYPSLPTLPSMGGPCPRESELDPEVLRGHLWVGGHMGCPVNWPSPGQHLATLSACSSTRSGCVSQERSQVPRPPAVPLGSQQLQGCDLPRSSQGCNAQCVVSMGLSREDLRAPVPPPHLGHSYGLSPDLTASFPFPASSVGTVLSSLGVEGAFCWCRVFSGDGTP